MNARIEAKHVISAERASQLAFDQLELVMQGMKTRELLRPVVAAALALVFFSSVAWPRLACWLAVALAGNIPAIVADRCFMARSPSRTFSASQWQRFLCLSHGLYATAWTSMVYFLWLPGMDFNHGMIMMALGCSASAVVPIFGACRPLSLTTFVIFGAGFLGTTILGGTSDWWAFSFLTVIYLVLLLFILRKIHAAAKSRLLVEYENSDLLFKQRRLICELAAAKQAAELKRLEAETANQSKSRFLANMSHELRTPLNAIIGFSEIIKCRIMGDNMNRNVEYAGLIHGSGLHLLALINDILDIAKLEANGIELLEQDVALDEIMREVVNLLERRAREGGCTLTCAVEPGLPLVRADKRALKQVLINLLSNALKFTLDGGTVTVFARNAVGGRVAFGVADNGVGIAPGDQAKVFEKFGQGRHIHVPRESGTGLGLAIVRELIHAHGGEIGLESVENEGTTVTIMLPASRTVPGLMPRSVANAC